MIFEAALLSVGVFSLIAAARAFMGPHVADRVVAMSAINTLVVAAMILYSAVSGSVVYVDVAIVYCTLSFVGTLFIARYLEGGL